MGFPVTSTQRSTVERLSAFRERFGTKAAVYKALDVALHKAFRASVHTVVWLDLENLTKMAPPDPQFTFRFLTAEEVETYAKDPVYFFNPALPDAIRAGRELCFGVLAGEQLAAFGCYSLDYAKPEQASGTTISFPSDVAYMSYGLTHPDFRGARLHGLAMALALEELSKRGITKLVSLVSWTNWASLKSCHRLGYINIGNMLTIGGRSKAIGLYPKAAKQFGVRFGRKATKPT